MELDYDVIVVGGGAAGLSAATILARARRGVLVLDAGDPRNAPAEAVHNFLGHDGVPPLELLARGREELARYAGHFRSATVTGSEKVEGGFSVSVADGSRFTARRLLVTTGLSDELPQITGLRERWGRDVLHCPYCHGWEVRDQAIAVLASSPMAAHQALLFTQWSSDVVLLLHDQAEPEAEAVRKLEARGARMVRGQVEAIETSDDAISGVRLAGGGVVPCQAVVVAPRFTARSGLLVGLGLTATDYLIGGSVFGTQVPSDPMGQTAVPGVYVAGNVTDPMCQVVTAAAAGMWVAAGLNVALLEEDVSAALGG